MSPRFAFQCQRNQARRRGIDWLLTFEQWWTIWDASGHWHQRGRNFGCYVMCRVGDVGAYEEGNVFIDTVAKNISSAHRKNGLPLGVYLNGKRYIAKPQRNGVRLYFGPFDTPEEAHVAYLNCEGAAA